MADDLFSKITELMADPEMSSKIKEVASSVAGQTSPAGDVSGDKLTRVLDGLSPHTRETALLTAIKPYLRASRAAKIDSAIRAAQLAAILKSL